MSSPVWVLLVMTTHLERLWKMCASAGATGASSTAWTPSSRPRISASPTETRFRTARRRVAAAPTSSRRPARTKKRRTFPVQTGLAGGVTRRRSWAPHLHLRSWTRRNGGAFAAAARTNRSRWSAQRCTRKLRAWQPALQCTEIETLCWYERALLNIGLLEAQQGCLDLYKACTLRAVQTGAREPFVALWGLCSGSLPNIWSGSSQ